MELREDLEYWHIIDLPDGTATPGIVDKRGQPAYLGIEDPSLVAGKRVLDVAALDGFWGFWAERQGAAAALTIDVECYTRYDWGYDGPPAALQGSTVRKDAVFQHLKELLESKVERESISVYDLDPRAHGQFDLVFCYGLLYHLRHPLLALDKMRGVCKGALVLGTHTLGSSRNMPISAFYLDDVLDKATTNWSGPTVSCIVHWLKSAGFPHVYYEKHPASDRQVLLAAITQDWKAIFDGNPHFAYADERYMAEARACLSRALRRGPLWGFRTKLFRKQRARRFVSRLKSVVRAVLRKD